VPLCQLFLLSLSAGGWPSGRAQIQAAGWEVPMGIGLWNLGPGFGKVESLSAPWFWGLVL
jgi:hypothetical protein